MEPDPPPPEPAPTDGAGGESEVPAPDLVAEDRRIRRAAKTADYVI